VKVEKSLKPSVAALNRREYMQFEAMYRKENEDIKGKKDSSTKKPSARERREKLIEAYTRDVVRPSEHISLSRRL
jgi:hypothetical protein